MATTPRMVRLLIAEDHVLVARALQSMLERRHTIAAMVHRGDEVLAALKRCGANCVLLDLEMPGANGLQLIKHIRRAHPDVTIVVVTMHADRAIADAALGEGALAFVPKDSDPAELYHAIAKAMSGACYRSKAITPATHRTGMEAAHPGLRQLTPRQHQVLLMLGEGIAAKEIAGILGVGQSTITFHKQNIMQQLRAAPTPRRLRWSNLHPPPHALITLIRRWRLILPAARLALRIAGSRHSCLADTAPAGLRGAHRLWRISRGFGATPAPRSA